MSNIIKSQTYYRDTNIVAKSRESLWTRKGRYNTVQTDITCYFSRSSVMREKVFSCSEIMLNHNMHLNLVQSIVRTNYDEAGSMCSCILEKTEDCIVDGRVVYQYDEMKDYIINQRDIGLYEFNKSGKLKSMIREMYCDGQLVDTKIITNKC